MSYYIPLILVVFAYEYALLRWNKNSDLRVNDAIGKWIKRSHYILFGIILIDLILNISTGFHYRGIWTSRIFIIGFILTGLITYPLVQKTILQRAEQIYFSVFSHLPIGLGIFALIPFLGAVVSLSLGLLLFNPVDNVLYDDDNMRIQVCGRGVLGSPHLMIVEKRLLTEGVRHDMNGFFTDKYDSLSVRYETDSIRIQLSSEQYQVYKGDTIFQGDLYFSIANQGRDNVDAHFLKALDRKKN